MRHKKKEYITTLSNSFKGLITQTNVWNNFTEQFFEQELDRILKNASFLYDSINKIGLKREEHKQIKDDSIIGDNINPEN